MPMIKAVLFDIDGVLLDSFEANWKFHTDLITKAGYKPASREEYRKLFHNSMFDNIKAITKSKSAEEIEKIYQMGVKREVPYHVELLTYPEKMKETIEELSKNYSLGIVTSRIFNSVYEPPQLAELKQNFKVVVSYEDTENHKPHPDPLLFAAKGLGVLPEECVYIGDVENDVIAAKAAGMRSIVFSKDDILGGYARTHIFQDLPKIIKSLD